MTSSVIFVILVCISSVLLGSSVFLLSAAYKQTRNLNTFIAKSLELTGDYPTVQMIRTGIIPIVDEPAREAESETASKPAAETAPEPQQAVQLELPGVSSHEI